jgi:ketosteroid isomerase-like protein
MVQCIGIFGSAEKSSRKESALRLMQRSVLILLLNLVLVGIYQLHAAAQAQTQSDLEQEVAKVDEERNQAILHSDVAVLNRILDKDFTLTSSNGQSHTKEELLEDFRSGNLKYSTLEHSEIRVRMFGKIALVSGVSISKFLFKGKPGGGVPRRYLNVYYKEGSEWRLVARQETPAPAQ